MAARDDMAAYMRARRARQRAEREAAGTTPTPVIDAAIPRDAILQASESELPSIRAKAAAIGSGAVITKTGGRLDVLRREDFEARSAPRLPAPAPASMYAIGGKPGRGLIPQGYGYPAPPDLAAVSNYTKWRSNTETMLAALAAKADEQERRIAALEAAAADRRTNALDFANALVGLFRFGMTGRAS